MNEDENFQRLENINGKLEDVQDRVRELEITLHGKRAKTGLLAEYERHDQLLARLYAVIWQDPTGQKGILHDIDILMERRTAKVQGVQYKWQFWGLILATIISSAAAVLTNLDKIIRLFPVEHPGILEQKIEKAKHPKGKKIYRYRIVPPPEAVPEKAPSDDTKENLEK